MLILNMEKKSTLEIKLIGVYSYDPEYLQYRYLFTE